jgi:hypothetical protein
VYLFYFVDDSLLVRCASSLLGLDIISNYLIGFLAVGVTWWPALLHLLGLSLSESCSLPIAFCRALSKEVFSATHGKVLLMVTTMFTESRTVGTRRHLAKTSLPSAKHSAKADAQQRVVSIRL